MQGRRSLRGPLFPSLEYTNRIARVRRDSAIRPTVLELGGSSSSPNSDRTMEEQNPPAVQRFMKDYSVPTLDAQPTAIPLNEAQRNYELKTVHFNTLPTYYGKPNEDALQFMKEYYNVITTIPLGRITENELRMRCFSYCLKGDAKQWLSTLEPGSLRTWSEVERKFFDKYFPSSRTKDIRGKIATFQEEEGEPFHEAWERFKLLLAQCPHHEFTLVSQVQSFYDGLTGLTQAIVDNACGGAMRELTAEEVLAKYEMLGQNSQQRSRRGSSGSVRDTEMAKNVATLTRDVQTMMRNLECTSTTTSPNTMIQSFYERPPMESCIMGNQNQNQGQLVVRENQANWVGRRPMDGPSSNFYNRGWERLPNRYWSNPNNFLNPPEDLEN